MQAKNLFAWPVIPWSAEVILLSDSFLCAPKGEGFPSPYMYGGTTPVPTQILAEPNIEVAKANR